MVRTKEVMLVFLLGIIFLSACSTQKNTSGVTGAYANCNGDETQMVTATFADFAPVSSETNPYQAGDDIDVEVVLTNKFSDDIDTGKARVRLTGDAAITSIFSGAQEKNAEKLFGIDSETCLEETTEVDVGPIVYQGEITTKVNKEITGLYCYEEPVVVKAYLYYTARAEEIGTNLPSGSNPASSVQVTQIEQNPVDIDQGEANGEMRFKIYLENVGTGIIVPSLNECFEYRDAGYREEFTIDVKGAYDIDCPDDVKLSRGDKTDVITCLVTGVDSTNLGAQASEISITLSGFAYEDVIPSTTIWLEP
ncbi:MAG TPA: hypothetical protein HA360_01295 [Nanoarchaeota archaeon]|nr:hypothetical protein [Candidatus Woesearchaeota archaeon]HIH15656.1 hypothetical protein [Nanoarchaeota archaeon]HIH58765.1 hypothetical protein [Nanoarchaeota archaeon]HII13687.1 hypothetical protein [Nanoarchaeota archaeon]HIJ05377.1 hypothetical protein [Nanoarchaeota archaeon]